jgi:hypothetical protein
VYIWDWQAGKRVATLYTVFEGRRVALNPAGTLCVIASWTLGGVACYSVKTGEPVWPRGDLKRVQYLTISPDGRLVYCGRDRQSCAILHLDRGKDHGQLRAVTRVYCSPFAPVWFLDLASPQRAEIRMADGERVAWIERVTFAFLDAAFSPTQLCTTETGGPVRCVDTATGAELWRHVPRKGRHYLKVSFSISAGCFFGLEVGPMKLFRFDPQSGKPSLVHELGVINSAAFCGKGEMVVASTGALISVLTGKVIRVLRFPRSKD